MVIAMAYLSVLDGVRAVAVLLVVACHLLFHLNNGDEAIGYPFATVGQLGVAIFFVHTALVLLGSLERHDASPSAFYVRRIFRIYPLAIIVILTTVPFYLSAHVPLGGERLISNLLLMQNLIDEQPYVGQMWSLPYEVQMYVFLPLIYAVITRARWPVFWVLLLYLVTFAIAWADPGNHFRFRITGLTAPFLRYVPCFMGGVLAYTLAGRIPRVLSPAWLAAFLACCIAFAPMMVSAGVRETPLMWAVCFVLGCIIPACREMKSKLIAAVAKTIATYSYGVYLTHMVALSAIDGLMPGPPVVQWSAMLILLVGLPYICYHYIEKRGVAWGARLAERLTRSERENLGSATRGN